MEWTEIGNERAVSLTLGLMVGLCVPSQIHTDETNDAQFNVRGGGGSFKYITTSYH